MVDDKVDVEGSVAETGLREEQAKDIETLVDRRRSPRAPVMVRVNYATVDALFSDFSRNINEGGMFVETENPPPFDALVNLQFSLPGSSEPIRVRGRVVRITNGEGAEATGMGIEFEDLEPETRARINDLIRALRSR